MIKSARNLGVSLSAQAQQEFMTRFDPQGAGAVPYDGRSFRLQQPVSCAVRMIRVVLPQSLQRL